MSTWSERDVTCPRCGATHRMRVALGLHIGRLPQAREDVLERRLHHTRCACGTIVHLRMPFEYTDLDRKHFVLVESPDELGRWASHETRLRATMRHAFELGSPLVHELVRDIAGRVVFAQEELREKLVLWAAGLDDAIVECIKVRAFASDPTLAAPASRLFVHRVGPDDSLECVWFARMIDPRPSRAVELPAPWIREAEDDRATLASRFPELFSGGFVSATRFLMDGPGAQREAS